MASWAVVGADVGIMGGSLAHEFMVLNEFGEDTLVVCDNCDFADNPLGDAIQDRTEPLLLPHA